MKSPSLAAAPLVADWLDLSEAGTVSIRTGKVELGQGVLTALVQVASRSLGIDPSRIKVVSGITGATPNEGYTAGSLSIPHSATALEAACDTCISVFRADVAKRFGLDPDAVGLINGTFNGPDLPDGLSIWSIAADIGLGFEVGDAFDRPLENRPGASLPRIDLPLKIAGGGMIQDIAVDDVLHARVLRPPRLGARVNTDGLSESDRADCVIEGSFVAVVDDDFLALARKAERLANRLTWSGGIELTSDMLRPETLRNFPHKLVEVGEEAADAPAGEEVTAVYRRPYLMHASIGCVTALARWTDEGNLAVISQTQGPYQLRSALAALFEIEESAVDVTHAPGAGCYGHNGADDVAGDAALIARHFPGRTVRVSWSRAEELASAPLSSAGEVEISAKLDPNGRPMAMSLDIVSATHARRPGTAPSGTLLAELQKDAVSQLSEPIELPALHGFGGLRNAMSPYAIPAQYAKLRLVDPPGLRTSAMRGLGTHLNVFAIESFIDELAARAGTDPLSYRLELLEDPRARHVLSRVAETAAWANRPEGGTGEGWGIAYSRYKGRAAYVATVAQVTVDEAVRVDRIWSCADAGRVINMDGLRNQIEGGIVQSASWALFEEVRLTDERTLPQAWDDYPILRFSDLPEISLEILEATDPLPLGAGEVAVGPTTAAISNAVAHALGVRLRSLPFSRDKIMTALLQV
ncbi:molybdopterin cofactor-binding domain-containing protein [Amorphus sp. 3PC139-8]|uniref:xanthine dehydrogenase family protein molybdopterin-binding subunit n=1 Tax=Amorphus sp. 3PC139-8 TaxID=2735676 RepID=UPI00345CA6F1